MNFQPYSPITGKTQSLDKKKGFSGKFMNHRDETSRYPLEWSLRI